MAKERNTTTFEQLIKSFVEEGATKGCSATGTLLIKENQLIHYATPLVERYGELFIVNNTRYSLATGKVQKQIHSIIPDEKCLNVRRVIVEYKGSLVDFLPKEVNS